MVYFGSSVLASYCFRYCANLYRLNVDNIVSIDASSMFDGPSVKCLSSYVPGVAFFPSLKTFKGDFLCFKTALLQIFMPAVDSFRTWSLGSPRLMDLGKNLASLNITYITLSVLVCRAVTPPSFSRNASNTKINSYIFVPADSVDAYKAATNWSDYASKIYAIGGTEWTTQFGSADEWADYDMYEVPHEESEQG